MKKKTRRLLRALKLELEGRAHRSTVLQSVIRRHRRERLQTREQVGSVIIVVALALMVWRCVS